MLPTDLESGESASSLLLSYVTRFQIWWSSKETPSSNDLNQMTWCFLSRERGSVYIGWQNEPQPLDQTDFNRWRRSILRDGGGLWQKLIARWGPPGSATLGDGSVDLALFQVGPAFADVSSRFFSIWFHQKIFFLARYSSYHFHISLYTLVEHRFYKTIVL